MVDQALDHLESKIDDVTDDDVDRLIRAMRDELVETKTRIPELEALLTSQLTQADKEKSEAEAALSGLADNDENAGERARLEAVIARTEVELDVAGR